MKLKFNLFVDGVIIAIAVALLFFMVFQMNHEIPKLITIDFTEGANINEYSNETVLKFMTYNMAHGRGHLSMYEKKSETARNFNIKSKEEVENRLDKMAKFIREENPDFLALNEVDFDTSWSYRFDQAEYLARKTGFPYVVEGIKWSWSLPFHKVRSGNAILSKYPVIEAKNTKFWSEHFLKKYIGGHSFLNVLYMVEGKPVRVVGTHFDSDSQWRRVKEAEQLVDLVELSKEPVIVAGDLNAVTPLAKQTDEKLGNRFKDETIEKFIESEMFDFDMELFRPTAEDMFTYSAENPHRLIDYIFATKDMQVTEYKVRREMLSDHFPLMARIIVSR